MTLELRNTYRQYKQDTKHFLCWLASTAAGHGWTPLQQPDDDVDSRLKEWGSAAGEASPPPPPPPVADNVEDASGPKTSKNRKKKNKKGASAASATAPPADTGPTYAVALRDFIPMAEVIASKSGPATRTIPSSISQILDRVIRLREAFSILLEHTAPSDSPDDTAADPASDDTHHHFVAILKQCRSILDAESVSTADAPATSDKPTSARQRLSSAFAALQLYEPSQSFLDAPPIATPSAVNYVLVEDDAAQVEESNVAFAALLQDVLALRAEANKLWRVEFVEGLLQLSPVAVATNTAIDLARRVESEVTPLLERVGGVGELLTRHYRTMVVAEGMKLPDDEDEFSVETYGIAKGCLFEAYYLMEQFRRQCLRAGAGEVPPLYDGRYGWFDEKKALSVKSKQAMFDRDRAALFELLSETAILVQKVKWNNVEDELTRGVRLILQNPAAPVPIWTVLAAQLFIDNLEILNTPASIGRVAYDINQIVTCFACRAQATVEYFKDKPRPAGWPAKKDSMLRRFEEEGIFFHLENSVLSKWKRRLAPELDQKRTRSVIMGTNSIFAGVWGHHLLTLFHTTGIAYTNAWGVVFAMHQLYVAGCRRSMLQRNIPWPFQWLDMLVMVSQQGDQRFWVGERPKEMAEFWKQWRLCHGASLAEVAREPDSTGLGSASSATQRPRRGLTELAPASLLLRGRLGSDTMGKARVEMSLDDLRKILGDAEWITTTPSPGNVYELVRQYDTSSKKRFGAAEPERSRPGPHLEHLDFSPTNLVDALAYTLFGELSELHFDYFLLTTKCWMCLNQIKQVGDYQNLWQSVLGTPNYLKREEQLPDLVGLIFRAAAGQVRGMSPARKFELLDFATGGLMKITTNDNGRLVLNQLEQFDIKVEPQMLYLKGEVPT
ncbi:hypothetical protein QBC39DRAFT_182446 [Podospora conica]|nr:hypothetical protein QBC39DRAFT_182446 [Schizothecium conicum]